MTTTNPKNLSDLRYQDNVIRLPKNSNIQHKANLYFKDFFNNPADVFVRKLFIEDNKIVYEAYQDGGSVDYLYIIVS